MAESIPRKLIRFGNSSFIVSLPKEWITKNKLKKGDLVYLYENSKNEIVMKTKAGGMKEQTSVTIKIDGKEMDELRRELNSAYINNYSEIILEGEEIVKKGQSIAKMIQEKVGLEISEQTNQRIVIKDILDFEAISVEKIIRRLDNVLRSMITDMIEGISAERFKEWTMNEIYAADSDINKFYFMSWKILRKCQEDPQALNQLKMNIREVSDLQWVILHLEYVGDEIKRTSKIILKMHLDDRSRKELLEVVKVIEGEYINMMTSFYNRDFDSVRKLSSKKKHIMTMCEKLFSRGDIPLMVNVGEKLKAVTSYVHNISKVIGYQDGK